MSKGLTKEQVEDLLLNVLHTPKIMPWKGSKIQFCCTVHGESHPSAGIDIDFTPEDSSGHFQVFHCFEGSTKVITDKGVYSIQDLAGKECRIINGRGLWESVKFKSYGKQNLWKIVLTSNNHEKTVYATSEHRWYVQKRKSEVFTKDLKVGQRLQRQWLLEPHNFSIDYEALRHGFLFGDGSYNKNVKTRPNMYNHSAKVCGEIKESFCKSIGFDIKPLKDVSKEVRGVIHYTCPYNAKTAPMTGSLNYIFNFLAGYFVADGNCSHQSISFSSSSEETVTQIKHFCTLVGIATYPISVQVRTPDSNMGVVLLNEEQKQYSIRLVKSTIPDLFWVSDKKPTYKETYKSYLGYSVKEVCQTDREEEVYCCETSTHSFVLDGFILTGNCFSCGASGTIPWLVFKSLPDEFKSLKQAEQFLRDRYHIDFAFDFDVDTLNIKRYEEHFVALEETSEKRFEMPYSKLALFKSGKETYKYFFDRGFTKKDMQEYMIGRDLDSKTVTIPAFWEDKVLAGVIGRYIDPKRPKNMRFKIYGFPKGSLIYPLDKLEVIDDTIIGVESMLDAILLRKWGYRNCVAMMGDGMSKQQAEQIVSRCSKFIDLFDNDDGGRTARQIAKKRFGDRVLYLIPHYYPDFGKDPSDWGEVETNAVIESAGLTSHSLPRL